MKIRASHIVVLVIVALGGLMLLVLLGPSSAGQKDNGDFIKEARERQEAIKGAGSVAGDMPAIDTDPSVVPVLSVDSTEFDMGVIPHTGPTTKEMMVSNTGKRDLKISQVKTSCGCTVGTFDCNSKTPGTNEDAVIPAGGKLPMYVTVNPFRVPGFYSHKTLTIYSSDPVNPTKEIDVISHIEPEYTIEPDTLDFGTIEMGTPVSQKIRIRQASDEAVKIKDVEITGRRNKNDFRDARREALGKQDPFTVALADVPASEWKTPNRPEWDVTVTLSSSLPLAPFQSQFYIISDAKRVPKIPYVLKADVKTFFRVEPPIIRVKNAAAPGQQKIATATVLSEQPFEVVEATVTGKDLTVVVRPGDNPGTVFLDLSVAPNAEPSLKTETLSMKVKSGEKTVDYSTRVYVSVKQP